MSSAGSSSKSERRPGPWSSAGSIFLTRSYTVNRWQVTLGVVYDRPKEMQYKKMKSLTGTFIKEEPEEHLDTISYFPFSICFPQGKLTLCASTKSEQTEWTKALKTAMGYANLCDFYELKVPSMPSHASRRSLARAVTVWSESQCTRGPERRWLSRS